jgi:hypothetical protein
MSAQDADEVAHSLQEEGCSSITLAAAAPATSVLAFPQSTSSVSASSSSLLKEDTVAAFALRRAANAIGLEFQQHLNAANNKGSATASKSKMLKPSSNLKLQMNQENIDSSNLKSAELNYDDDDVSDLFAKLSVGSSSSNIKNNSGMICSSMNHAVIRYQ